MPKHGIKVGDVVCGAAGVARLSLGCHHHGGGCCKALCKVELK